MLCTLNAVPLGKELPWFGRGIPLGGCLEVCCIASSYLEVCCVPSKRNPRGGLWVGMFSVGDIPLCVCPAADIPLPPVGPPKSSWDGEVRSVPEVPPRRLLGGMLHTITSSCLEVHYHPGETPEGVYGWVCAVLDVPLGWVGTSSAGHTPAGSTAEGRYVQHHPCSLLVCAWQL